MTSAELVKKANEAVKAWESEIGAKSTHRMLKNVLVNSIKYYDETHDGNVINHLLAKIVEVMNR